MQVKCTSCGAQQNISEAQNCEYCGNLIELEVAKNNYQSALNCESGNLMAMAETAIEATNWEEALQFYNQVLTKEISNSDAWLGKGIAIVYSSKIGDIKITEAITYWKNALKHAPNQEAMGKRVAKEINNVVKIFFPNLLNHYKEFSNLDDTYLELASRFLVLEGAIDYAINLCPDNADFFQTGFDLCNQVIKAPNAFASSAQGAAAASMVFNTLAGNKYSAKTDQAEYFKAKQRKNQIDEFANKIKSVQNKYTEGLIRLGVLDESILNLTASKQIDIEVEKFNKMKKENIIVIICFVILYLISIIGNLSSDEPKPELIFLLLFAFSFYYAAYFAASLNRRSKKYFGESWIQTSKRFKNK